MRLWTCESCKCTTHTHTHTLTQSLHTRTHPKRGLACEFRNSRKWAKLLQLLLRAVSDVCCVRVAQSNAAMSEPPLPHPLCTPISMFAIKCPLCVRCSHGSNPPTHPRTHCLRTVSLARMCCRLVYAMSRLSRAAPRHTAPPQCASALCVSLRRRLPVRQPNQTESRRFLPRVAFRVTGQSAANCALLFVRRRSGTIQSTSQR